MPPIECASGASAARRAKLAVIRLFVLAKVEKKNVLIIYAPRRVRERSERCPKGEKGLVWMN